MSVQLCPPSISSHDCNKSAHHRITLNTSNSFHRQKCFGHSLPTPALCSPLLLACCVALKSQRCWQGHANCRRLDNPGSGVSCSMHCDHLAVLMQRSETTVARSGEQQSGCAASAASSPVTPNQAALPLTTASAVSSSELRLSHQVLPRRHLHLDTTNLLSAVFVSIESMRAHMLIICFGCCRAALLRQKTGNLTPKSAMPL